jgi:hypothetical protein
VAAARGGAMTRARARIGRARRERVGSSGGFGRGDGHEPARELVWVRLVGGEGRRR